MSITNNLGRIPNDATMAWAITMLKVAEAAWATRAAIYDFVPENAPYPFVHVGPLFETPDAEGSSRDFNGSQVVLTHQSFSTYKGGSEVNTIMNQILAAYDVIDTDVDPVTSENLDIGDEFTLYDITRESSETVLEDSPQGENVYQGILRIRLFIVDIKKGS